MSAHGFRSVFMVASVAGAALGCYLVSLNVASERAKLEAVEGKIVLAQRDIRVLQTEIGTRGRLAQLERWNVGFIRLSAPSADQFLEGGFQLATLVKPATKPVIDAPVVLASAPAEQKLAQRPVAGDGDEAKPVGAARPAAQSSAPSASDMMRVASYSRPPVESKTAAMTIAKAKSLAAKPVAPKPAAAKGTKVAAADGLAPLPAAKAAAKAPASGGLAATASTPRKTKEPGSRQ